MQGGRMAISEDAPSTAREPPARTIGGYLDEWLAVQRTQLPGLVVAQLRHDRRALPASSARRTPSGVVPFQVRQTGLLNEIGHQLELIAARRPVVSLAKGWICSTVRCRHAS